MDDAAQEILDVYLNDPNYIYPDMMDSPFHKAYIWPPDSKVYISCPTVLILAHTEVLYRYIHFFGKDSKEIQELMLL